MFGTESDISPLCSCGTKFVLLISDQPGKAGLLSAWFDSKQSRDIVELPQTRHPWPAFFSIASERARLSGTCWILIRMVVWSHLVASLCFFSRQLQFFPETESTFL